MSVRYLSPSNPGATTQAERDAAATANWNAIKAAAAAVNTTASPVRVGPGGNQGIIRLRSGIWWMSPTQMLNPANGFNNRVIWGAPGATIIASDGNPGHIFTMGNGVQNCWVIGAPWAADGAEPAELATMTNKTGAGWPTIKANLGGGDPDGPSITANGDPRVPWTIPVKEMMSVGVDKQKWAWINNHCGFINAQDCTNCGHDRQFYFGYVEANSGGTAMMVPRATSAAGGGVNGNGNASPHNFTHSNQFGINMPQGFGLNQWTDCRGFIQSNTYCVGGEGCRMETHKPNDGGVHNGVLDRIAQSGGNVGIALVPHQATNGQVQISYVWNHSAEAGAFKIKPGSSPTSGSFAAGSFIRHFTSIGGNRTWGQKQSVPAGGSEGNEPTLPQRACVIDSVSWRNNIAIGGDIAFGHMNNMGSVTGGIPINSLPGTAEGFQMGSGFGGANASDGIKATTRDLTGPHPDGPPPPPPPIDLNQDGTITPHATHTLVPSVVVIGDLTGRAGTITPAGSQVLSLVDISLAAPEWERTPSNPSTDQAAFFRAALSGGQNFAWRWQIDDDSVVNGAPSAEEDYRTFPVSPGLHSVTVYAIRPDGAQTLPLTFDWLVPSIQVPAPSPNDLLGCGAYTVYVQPRGGGKPLFSIPFTSLSWERVESATGQAQIQVDGISNYGDDCCKSLNEITPWVHELRIYRDNRAMWVGPVVGRNIDGEKATINARDVSQWAARRRIGKALTHTQKDVAVVARDYWADGLSRDKSPNIRFTTVPAGTLTDRVTEANKAMVDAQINDLVGLGLSWAVVQRTIVLGVRQYLNSPVARLMDASFVDDPAIDSDGLIQVNDLYTWGEGGGEGADQPVGSDNDNASVARYGLLEGVQTDSDIKDNPSAIAASRTQVALRSDTPATIAGGTLSTVAPITIDELVGGGLVDIRLSAVCVPVAGIYRMVKIAGKADANGAEAISLDVELS